MDGATYTVRSLAGTLARRRVISLRARMMALVGFLQHLEGVTDKTPGAVTSCASTGLLAVIFAIGKWVFTVRHGLGYSRWDGEGEKIMQDGDESWRKEGKKGRWRG